VVAGGVGGGGGTAPLCPLGYGPGHVSSKFEVSMAFRFRVNVRHGTDGQTDGRAGCNTPTLNATGPPRVCNVQLLLALCQL